MAVTAHEEQEVDIGHDLAPAVDLDVHRRAGVCLDRPDSPASLSLVDYLF